MASLIGFLMTLYPYAAAAASLATDAARDLFATLIQVYRYERPEFVRGMVEKRYGRRR